MANAANLNGRGQRRSLTPRGAPRTARGRVPADLLLVAALIGLGKGLLGFKGEAVGADGEPDRGRSAERPSEIPATGWLDIAWRVFNNLQNDRVLLVAAGVTFYGLLVLFPATAALVSLYGLFADASTINQHLQLVSGFLPEGASTVIADQIKRIAANGQGKLGLAFIGTLAFCLWGANSGTKSIFEALNVIYKEREKRGFLRLTLQSMTFTLCGIVLVLLAIAGIVAVPVMLTLFGVPGGSALSLLSLWPLLYAVILLALSCLYSYGPSRARPRWHWVSRGSAAAGAIWLIGSLLLSWYVARFGTYNATYGSLGAVIGFMVWMWLSTIVVLLGAEINAEMEHQMRRDTTQGTRKPMGTRGARMADEIGQGHIADEPKLGEGVVG